MPTTAPTPYVCLASDTPFTAIEKSLDNGTNACLVISADGKLLGEVTLEMLRDTIRGGAYLSETRVDSLARPCKQVLHVGDTAKTTAVLTPIVDADHRLVDVKINQLAEFVPVAQPNLSHHEFRNLMDVYLSTWISSTGDYIRSFESRFANYCGMTEGVATSNGTVSLHLALLALGIGAGDEVIVPDLTFAASINAILYVGATPVIVDVEDTCWGMTAAGVEAAITPRTKAVMPVHVFGRPCQIAEIAAVAKKHKLFVVEDCAEAHGAKYNGQMVGSFSDIASFSFFANKIITTGEGGICITNSPELAKKMRVLRDHGMQPERRYWHEQVGYNYRMTNMQAAIGCGQLDRIDEFLAQKRKLADMYADAFKDIPGIRIQDPVPSNVEPVVWFVCAQVPADKRAALMDAAKKENIDIRPFFNALSIMPAYTKYVTTPCPVSVRLSQSGINLPTSHRIDAEIVQKIAEICRRVLVAAAA
jgi:perosamine synthetase